MRTSFLDHLTTEELLHRLVLALDGAEVGVWDWDLRDDRVQFDRRWCAMLGLHHPSTPMELKTWSSRVHPDDLDGCLVDIRAHLEGRTERYENVHRMRHADGSWLYILDRGRIAARDEDGRPVRFTGTHADVTLLERARQVLSDHDQRLQAMVEHLPTGVAMLDRGLSIVTSNHRFGEAFAAGDQDLVGRPLGEVSGAIGFLPACARALEGADEGGDEEPIVDAAGRERWLRWTARRWTASDGAVGGVLLCCEDVSARVAERRATEREREARLSALAAFAGGIAHEINSPLQVVVSGLEVLRHELAGSPSPEVLREGVDLVEQAARRAAAITRALRTLARDARQDPPEPARVSVLLQDLDALCSARFRSAGVPFVVDDEGGDTQIRVRPAELLHALLQLLHPPSEPSEALSVRVGHRRIGAEVWIEVAGLPSPATAEVAREFAERAGGRLVFADPPRGFALVVPLAGP